MDADKKPHVLMMAGGTGGHVFPALAVARELIMRGARVSWLGTEAGIEARLVRQEGLPLYTIDVGGLRGKRLTTLLAAPVTLTRALWQTGRLLHQLKPDLVVGMGGFASGPGGLLARLSRVPLLIHEQNAAAGLTNRVLARLAQTVLQAFPQTFADKYKPITVGNPVRADILALPSPQQRWAQRQDQLRLLVLGGSGGALAINERVPAALAQLDAKRRPQVWHQAGRTLAAAQSAYESAGVDGHVEAFIDDMAQAYAWADVVVCRSGALTVAELAAAGVPALLIPYPYAVDDHQRANGQYLVQTGAARLLDQQEMTVERLATELSHLLASRSDLLARADAARSVAWPDATMQIVQSCYKTLEKG